MNDAVERHGPFVIQGLSKIYGSVLFEAAMAQACVTDIKNVFSQWLALFQDHPQLEKAFCSPAISLPVMASILDVLIEIIQSPPLFVNFLKTVLQKRRFHLLPEISAHFQALISHEKGERHVQMCSALPLTAAQTDLFHHELTQFYNQPIVLAADVDPGLYGGFTLQSQGTFIDASLKGRLSALQHSLTGTI